MTEMAVWSGDTVRMDEEGFLYFIGRKDEMIKTSGYRVSPTEVEEVVYASGLVGDAVAVGRAAPDAGQAIVRGLLCACARDSGRCAGRSAPLLLAYCKPQPAEFHGPAAHRMAGRRCRAIPTASSTGPRWPLSIKTAFEASTDDRSTPSRSTRRTRTSTRATANCRDRRAHGRAISSPRSASTPFYVYDRAVMTRKVQELRAALPRGPRAFTTR